jgi:hypothetical protein
MDWLGRLLGVDRAFWDQSHFEWRFLPPPWIQLLAIAAVAVWAIFIYSRERASQATRRRLAGVRALLWVWVLLLLAGPILTVERATQTKSSAVVLIDVSRSMGLGRRLEEALRVAPGTAGILGGESVLHGEGGGVEEQAALGHGDGFEQRDRADQVVVHVFGGVIGSDAAAGILLGDDSAEGGAKRPRLRVGAAGIGSGADQGHGREAGDSEAKGVVSDEPPAFRRFAAGGIARGGPAAVGLLVADEPVQGDRDRSVEIWTAPGELKLGRVASAGEEMFKGFVRGALGGRLSVRGEGEDGLKFEGGGRRGSNRFIADSRGRKRHRRGGLGPDRYGDRASREKSLEEQDRPLHDSANVRSGSGFIGLRDESEARRAGGGGQIDGRGCSRGGPKSSRRDRGGGRERPWDHSPLKESQALRK